MDEDIKPERTVEPEQKVDPRTLDEDGEPNLDVKQKHEGVGSGT